MHPGIVLFWVYFGSVCGSFSCFRVNSRAVKVRSVFSSLLEGTFEGILVTSWDNVHFVGMIPLTRTQLRLLFTPLQDFSGEFSDFIGGIIALLPRLFLVLELNSALPQAFLRGF
jgi:hypothetical protein